jgi:Bor protein
VTRQTANLLALLVLVSTGCHTFRFHVSAAPSAPTPVVEHKSFWVFAWFPTQEVDVRAICPDGVATIEEETTFLDGFISTLTLSIYSPRTSYYYCRLSAPPAAAPPAGVTP